MEKITKEENYSTVQWTIEGEAIKSAEGQNRPPNINKTFEQADGNNLESYKEILGEWTSAGLHGEGI